jgi:hypothetical protein
MFLQVLGEDVRPRRLRFRNIIDLDPENFAGRVPLVFVQNSFSKVRAGAASIYSLRFITQPL